MGGNNSKKSVDKLHPICYNSKCREGRVLIDDPLFKWQAVSSKHHQKSIKKILKKLKKLLTNKTKYAIMNTSNEGDVKNV